MQNKSLDWKLERIKSLLKKEVENINSLRYIAVTSGINHELRAQVWEILIRSREEALLKNINFHPILELTLE